MTDERRAHYLRLVLYLISRRKWKNGCLVELAAEALRRTSEPSTLRNTADTPR